MICHHSKAERTVSVGGQKDIAHLPHHPLVGVAVLSENQNRWRGESPCGGLDHRRQPHADERPDRGRALFPGEEVHLVRRGDARVEGRARLRLPRFLEPEATLDALVL